jgi:hypothetical protein
MTWDAERRTIRGDAIEVLKRLTSATAEQVSKHLPQWTPHQVATAMAQAAHKGMIPRVDRLQPRRFGKGRGQVVYGAPPKPPLWEGPRPFNSVFEMGTRALLPRAIGLRVRAVLEALEQIGPATRGEVAPFLAEWPGDPSQALRRAVSYGLAEALPSPTYKTRYRAVRGWQTMLEDVPTTATPVKRDFGRVNSVFALGSMNGAATLAAME